MVEYGPLGILEVPSLVFNTDDVSIYKPKFGFKNDSSILSQTIITQNNSPIKMVIFLKIESFNYKNQEKAQVIPNKFTYHSEKCVNSHKKTQKQHSVQKP